MSATITLPDNLARDAAQVGLTQAAIERLLRAEIERLRAPDEATEEPRDWSKVSNRELLEQINAVYADDESDEEDYEIRLSNEELRAQIEEAYSDAPDEDEKLWLAHSKRQLRRLTENDEW